MEQFNQKWKVHLANTKAVLVTQYPRRGRPTAEDQNQAAGYTLEGSLEENATAIAEANRSLGRFIIATND